MPSYKMHIKEFFCSNELLEHAAKDFWEEGSISLNKKDFFDVALLGGGTAKLFFQALKNSYLHEFDKVKTSTRFFFSDERVVSLNDNNSNAGAALDLLVPPFLKEQFYPPVADVLIIEKLVKSYERTLLTKLKTSDGTPDFDVIYLGIGEDGHTASLFPYNPLLKDSESLVAGFTSQKIKFSRITFCPRLINKSKKIVFLAIGKEKQEVINKALKTETSPLEIPIKLFFEGPNHKNTHLWFCL